MSSAFVKEEEGQWLRDIAPTMTALINYLTRENNGVRVYERNSFIDGTTGNTVYIMSNGGEYIISEEGKWQML